MKCLTILFVCILFSLPGFSQQKIQGIVQSRDEQLPMKGVQIINEYDSSVRVTDSFGRFEMTVRRGQLYSIYYPGYVVARFRISEGFIPNFFKLYLDKNILINPDRYAYSELTAYQKDSIERYNLYKTTLEIPRMSGVDAISSPFSAMSKRNRMAWDFQDRFAMEERERYIDFTFNAQLVHDITKLEGEDLALFMRRFRPKYEDLRGMDTYTLMTYIRTMADYFRRHRYPDRPRNSG
jgi:hypothetical protein